jgi:GntR family transcriptional repressor for pyruvate dehydrogenase complex
MEEISMSEKTKKREGNFNSIVDSKSKSMKVAEQIMEAIDEGNYEPGDKLPSEIKLAEEMGVSRPSIREALSGLNAVGIVEARKGSGTYVSNPSPRNSLAGRFYIRECGTHVSGSDSQQISDVEASSVGKVANCLKIIRARQSLEPTALELIINEVTEDDLNELEAILNELKKYSESADPEKYLSADHDFHRRLIDISSNEWLCEAMKPLVSSMNREAYRELILDYYLTNKDRIQKCYRVHKSIYEAIAEKDYFAAKSGMHHHWSLVKEALEVRDFN